ncbi:MAG: methanethiol S-methyltransferase [Pseudomonadota bacterium]
MLQRSSLFAWSLFCYAVFFATFLYAVGFIGNLFVPKAIDSVPELPLWQAIAVNAGLLLVFALQHSVMARPAFKRWWTQVIPPAAERATYVLMSSLAMILLFWGWQPIGGVIWQVQAAPWEGVILGLYLGGWLLLLAATFMLDHFELFGLRQAWHAMRDEPAVEAQFKTPWLYNHVRHPIYVGWLAIVWATPTMTAAHLLFALGCTGYILVGTLLEERDLQRAHPEYAEYKRRVPMLVPSLRKRWVVDGAPVTTATVGEA